MINLLICLATISVFGFAVAVYLAATSGGLPDIDDVEESQ